MTVTVMRDTIQCPSCGSQRVVSPSWRRRSASKGGTPCADCRGASGAPARSCKDKDLRFWLRAYGSEPPPDIPVRDFLAAGGAPPELVELAQTVWPPKQTRTNQVL